MRSPQFICFRWESTHQGPMSHSMRGVHPWEHLCTNVRVQGYLLRYEATLFVEEGTLIANFLTIVVQERNQPTSPTAVVS
jgi:hypothetical protein